MSTNPTLPKWEKLLSKQLQLKPKFFSDKKETIRKRLVEAYLEMSGKSNEGQMPAEQTLVHSEMFGIHECFHLATSLVMMGTTPETLKKVLADISDGNVAESLAEKNPITVVTVVTLYYLVTKPKEWSSPAPSNDAAHTLQSACDFIKKRFNELNWMIGPGSMRDLGI